MSKNKGYNSIFFLTTLGVYLGLALVGASPTVLAQQAALTQRFEIQKEVEFDEDLDKKPDGDESLENYLLVRLDSALKQFIGDLHELDRRGKYKRKGEFSTGFFYNYCSEESRDAGSSIAIEEDDWFYDPVSDLRKKLDVADGGRNIGNLPGFVEASVSDEGSLCKWFDAGVSIDKSEFEVSISFSQNPQQAPVTAENLTTLFSIKAVNAQNAVTKQVYENTKAKAENEYVRIVTRLPRGSLNQLVRSKGQAI
ncbi:MAG: hypothetical protein R2747_12785 [Pyrinomonadaceae bacterium]